MLMKASSSWSLPSLPPGLWYCRDCFEAQLISDMSSLVYKYDLDEDRKDEFKDEEIVFRRKHSRHHLLPLKKKKDRCFMDRPAWDPLRTAYEEVTDSRETFILKSWRTDPNMPRSYALLRGTLSIETTVRLPQEPLRQELAQAFACSSQTMDVLMSHLQRAAAAFPVQELAPIYFAADDPDLLFAQPNARHVQVFTQLCEKTGVTLDKAHVHDFFIHQQREDSLLLELRQQCEVRFS